MKSKNVAILTTMGLVLQLLFPQPVGAEYYAGDLQRLHWLCSDFQLPIKGYVIEGWLALPNGPGLQTRLEQQLQIPSGQQQGSLLDGSTLNTSLRVRDKKIYIELQLITEQLETARHYYGCWQSVADSYDSARPVGITVITQLPERLDAVAQEQLAGELLQSLQVEPQKDQQQDQEQFRCLDALQQTADWSPQLQHWLNIGGKKININLAFAEREQCTVLYLATPVIYQQY